MNTGSNYNNHAVPPGWAARRNGGENVNQNVIFSINGPVVTVRGSRDFSMQEMVLVGNKRLVGEVISISDSVTTIQVYESTTGLRPGEPVEPTGSPICATLAPGILSNIFDGIQRPLREMEALSGAFISEGGDVSALDRENARLVEELLLSQEAGVIHVCHKTDPALAGQYDGELRMSKGTLTWVR